MTKHYPDTLFEEIKLLAKFPTQSQLEGLKIHHDAAPEIISAAQSLFDKGLISLPDGGYLTDSGIETADHLQRALTTLG